MFIHILIKKGTDNLIIDEIIKRVDINVSNYKRIIDMRIISGEVNLAAIDIKERLSPYWEVECVIQDGKGKIL